MNKIDPRDDFNSKYYLEVNKARDNIFNQILPTLIDQINLITAIDVGCGIGYYTSYLSSLGLQVTGIDARKENIEIAKSEVSQTKFLVKDIEKLTQLKNTAKFDLVFCAGLLYHLENPFIAIRNFKELCKKLCVIESRVHWSESPITLLVKDAEGPSQALNNYAMIPTRRCLINMLYASGFNYVYSVKYVSDHEELKRNNFHKSRRHFFVASLTPISMIGLKYEPISINEDMTSSTPYKKSTRRFYKSILESFHWLFDS